MSSAAGSWFHRILVRIPGLYRKQPCGNFHPFWHRLCFCREYEYCGDWKGGILDLKTGAVYTTFVKRLSRMTAGRMYLENVLTAALKGL